MKRAIVVTIAALMIACVLPMARAQESASNQEGPVVKRVDNPLSQQMAQMEAQLNELKIQQEKLQNELRALAEQRNQMRAQGTQRHVPEDVNVDEGADQAVEVQVEREVEGEILHAREEASLAAKEARLAAKEVAKAAKEAQKAQKTQKGQDEHWQQWNEQMRAWGDQMRQWQNSDEMKQWKEQMQSWAQEQAGQHQGAGAAQVSPPGPMPAMPPMPAVPPMGDMPGPVVVPTPHVQVTPHVVVPHAEAAPPLPPTALAPADVQGPEQTVPCGEYVVESFPADGVLKVENALGSIVVEGVEGSVCTVKAAAKIRDADKEEAEEIARGIKVHVTPTDGRVQVRAELPEGMSEEQRNRIEIDFHIVVPNEAKVEVAQKVGDIRLSSLLGDVKAATDVGSIQALQLQGDASLLTNVGNIDFTASRDLSAKVQAQANVGSVTSDLPLKITRAAAAQSGDVQNALGSNAKGIFGSGEKNVKLAANVGSIQVRQASSPPEQK